MKIASITGVVSMNRSISRQRNKNILQRGYTPSLCKRDSLFAHGKEMVWSDASTVKSKTALYNNVVRHKKIIRWRSYI